MNSARLTSMDPAAKAMSGGDNHLEYRTVSKSAVVCIVFAIMGLLSFLFSVFIILPFLSLCFGVAALVHFRRFPDQLSGSTMTKIAMAVSAIVFFSAVSMHAYVYATEVPEGYQRIAFYELEPKRTTPTAYSDKAKEYNGEQVFVKGYVRPGLKKNRLKKFILVGDFGSCCFGGSPKLTDVIAVTIKNDDHVNYGYRKRRIGGEFKLHDRRPKSVQEKDLPYVLYEIEADYIK